MKKFLKRLTQSDQFVRFIAFLASFYLRFIYWTSSWQHEGIEHPTKLVEEDKPFIVCFWHGRLMMLVYAWCWKKTNPFHMLISSHRDGRLIAYTVEHLGIHTFAGSSSKKGAEAFRHMLGILKKNQVVGVTPDGPKGPAFVLKDGVIKAAYLARVPIVPLTFSISTGRFLKSWDKFLLAKPFGKGLILWGNPIYVNKDPGGHGTFDKAKQEVTDAMQTLCRQADKKVQIAYE